MRHPNGYGSVYKLPGKRRKPYVVRKTIGWTEDGKQVYCVIGYYRTKQEGLSALAAYNDNPYDLVMSKVTFSDIYDRWYKDTFDEDSNRSTVRNYQAAYKHCSALYSMKMADIRPHHLQQVLDACPGGYATIKRVHILFNQIYAWCIRHDCIKKNYSEAVTVGVKSEPAPKNIFTADEISTLWSNANEPFVGLILMLIYSGVRVSELLDLQKSDTHLDEQWFLVRASKTDAGIRRVPIADKVMPFWRDFIDRSVTDYVICKQDGQPIRYSNLKDNYWKKIMTHLNMKHTIHETRHTCITMLVVANVNQTIIKKIVGHKSVMNLTEKVYTHIETKELLDAINSI